MQDEMTAAAAADSPVAATSSTLLPFLTNSTRPPSHRHDESTSGEQASPAAVEPRPPRRRRTVLPLSPLQSPSASFRAAHDGRDRPDTTYRRPASRVRPPSVCLPASRALSLRGVRPRADTTYRRPASRTLPPFTVSTPLEPPPPSCAVCLHRTPTSGERCARRPHGRAVPRLQSRHTARAVQPGQSPNERRRRAPLSAVSLRMTVAAPRRVRTGRWRAGPRRVAQRARGACWVAAGRAAATLPPSPMESGPGARFSTISGRVFDVRSRRRVHWGARGSVVWAGSASLAARTRARSRLGV